ncbi:hypothetical protein KYB31_07890 [Clostridium felsineum]|uniref:hypothetical protein n=1 Tax=Clostridium felsineum TaxID=36839 RepID=UPI00214DE09F|nr:hypothetical protein [Clostridium felsineum]MCR3758910.1 hypothetical protein [Clostridium felsineum]
MSLLTIKNKNSNGNNQGKFKSKDKEQAEKLVQGLLQIEDIQDDFIYAGEVKRYFIRVKPKNINILMENILLGLIGDFKKVLNANNQLQVLVVDKTQKLDANKTFLKELIDKKENMLFKEILRKDLDNLNKISSKGASREFYFIVPFRTFKEKERIEQMKHTIENQGFEVLDCSKNDLRSMLQVYMERNFNNEIVKNYDI